MLRSRTAGVILQVLLSGGTYRLGVTMIGAMPAVAVRHERRKNEKRTKRPSQLYLGGYGLRRHNSPPSRASSPTPSPLQSPPTQSDSEPPPEFYVCGKVSILHLVVVSLLLGAILLIVGLVQLKPGADASHHRYYLMAIGSFLMVLGLILTAVRCCLLPAHSKRQQRLLFLQRIRREESQASAFGLAGPAQSSMDNEKNAQVEMQNGMNPVALDDVKVELGVDEVALVNGSSSSVTDTVITDPLPLRVSVSSSGDGLHTTMTSPSEHDVLINKSSSNLGQGSCT